MNDPERNCRWCVHWERCGKPTRPCEEWEREPGSDDEKGELKVIIAGGRDYRLTVDDLYELNRIPISEVVSGGATGVDASGEGYAEYHGIPVKQFPADWQTHGKAAGPIRNKQMAEYADAVALFPGGRGTESMHREAVKAGIKIFDFRKGE